MRQHLPDILAVIGAATTTSGVAMVHVPTAVMLAGAAVMLTGYLLHKARP